MADVLHGNAGANQLNARADKSQVYGLKGNDTLTSSDKRDVLLVGGSGDDSLIMSGGNGTLSGGDGSDTFELTYSATKPLSAVIEDLEPSSDKIFVNFDGNTAPQLNTTTSGNDVVLSDGNLLSVTLNGVRDNDYFDGTADDNAWKVLELTNAEREAQGLSALTMADGLTAGASVRAQEITKQGTLGLLTDHTRPDGSQWYTVLNGKYNFPGENLDGGARSPAQVVQQEWMKSYDHRENILRDNFQKLGVAYNEYDEDPSNLRFYWVQLFADSLNAQSVVDVSSASPQLNTVSKFIQGDDEPNTISNGEYGVTIDARGGGDSVTNTGLLVSISGGEGDDTLNNSGNFATLNGGHGNDRISLNAAQEVVIQYASGDGSDTVSGLNATDTVTISGDEFTPAQVGDDVIVTVGSDSITLLDAAKDGVQLLGARSKLIILTDGGDSLDNTEDDATIQAKGGNDTITNYYGDNVSIDGGAGNDTIANNGTANVSISSGAGDDSIDNWHGDNVTIEGDEGNDIIESFGDNTAINGGAGNDSIDNGGRAGNDTIDGGADNDTIANWDPNVSINGSTGNDSIINGNPFFTSPVNVSINGGDGKDTIENYCDEIIIDGGAGNDSIINRYVSNVTIEGDADNDSIFNRGDNFIINGGLNNDMISIDGAQNNLIQYTSGDGRDTVIGFNETSTLQIGDGTSTYSKQFFSDDVIIYVGRGSITLRDATSLSAVNIQGSEREYVYENINVYLTAGNDTYNNTLEGTIINVSGDGKSSITNTGANVLIFGNRSADIIVNDAGDVEIYGVRGNNSIINAGANNYLFGGSDNDYITNSGDDVSISGGMGDDTIEISSEAQENFIFYTAGDGNDIIRGFKSNDSLLITNYVDSYATQKSGNDVILHVGSGSITLDGAASLEKLNIFVIMNVEGDFVTLSDSNEAYENSFEGVTIAALDGDDTIGNLNVNSSINGGNGNDYIYNYGNSVTIDGGAGNDTIESYGDSVTIDGGAGSDSIYNDGGDNVSISGGAGDDSIDNWHSDSVTIDGGVGDDTIYNYVANSTINGSEGNDYVGNYGENVISDGGDGNDTITNFWTFSSIMPDYNTVKGGAGDDLIRNLGSNTLILGGTNNDTILNGSDGTTTANFFANDVTINGDDGDDYIINHSNDVSINGGAGDDIISLASDGENIFIQYTAGEGNDTIWGLTENSSIQIGNGYDTYSTVGTPSGDDIIIHVGANTITLKNYRADPENIIIGASGTSGGTSSSGNGGTSSSSNGGTSSSGNGGTSSSSNGGTSSSGNGSGSSGRSASTGSSGGNSFRRQSHSTTTDTPTVTTSTETTNPLAATSTASTTTQQTATQHVYTGSNQVIADYTSGERIIFGATYTGAFFDGNGNFFAGSTTGALVVQNATDKVIDLGDAAGNSFVKAYSATTAGIIDGRGLDGFEVINGSAGSDAIYAGDGGSQLWGGLDTVSDAMMGGNGTDIFIGGKNQGADFFLNASSTDIVHLNDATLSDIVATAEENGTIGIAFNTGNVVAIQSSEALSATVMLADGSA